MWYKNFFWEIHNNIWWIESLILTDKWYFWKVISTSVFYVRTRLIKAIYKWKVSVSCSVPFKVHSSNCKVYGRYVLWIKNFAREKSWNYSGRPTCLIGVQHSKSNFVPVIANCTGARVCISYSLDLQCNCAYNASSCLWHTWSDMQTLHIHNYLDILLILCYASFVIYQWYFLLNIWLCI